MKHPSFLNAVSQPFPHRTSVHSHMQSTAYHYNSILNAKAEINNSRPNQNISLDILNNKRAKNLKKQRTSQNQKLLKSLIDIQRNYSLYGTKNQSQLTNHDKKQALNVGKRKSIIDRRRVDAIDSAKKTLKNPFVQKMKTLNISQENLKLFDKINNIESSFASKKQMKQWSMKLNYWGSFLQSSRSKKQSTESLKNKFFSTFIRLRDVNNLQQANNGIKLQTVSNTLRLESIMIVKNPQLKTLSNSKRIATSINNETSVKELKESFRIKKKKKKNKKSRKIQQDEDFDSTQRQGMILYTDH